MLDREQALAKLWPDIDNRARFWKSVTATVLTSTGARVRLYAGEGGVNCWPQQAPFEAYDVRLNRPAPPMWRRYCTEPGAYGMVPRLLITDLITSWGGVERYILERRPIKGVLHLTLQCPDEARVDSVNAIMAAITDPAVKLTDVAWTPPKLPATT